MRPDLLGQVGGVSRRLHDALTLGAVLDALLDGGYELLAHWTQGEFHHDVVLRCHDAALPGPVLVVATNCNGGVKELCFFDDVPDRDALWHERCPDGEFAPHTLPPLRARHRTVHWFDPCELLTDDARSELRPECRVRQRGGGWMPSG